MQDPSQLLVHRVLAGYRLSRRGIHGPAHWLRVRANGLALAAATAWADAAIIAHFALLHDGWREDEGHDAGHGARAADAARALAAEGALPFDGPRLAMVLEACRWHEHGSVTADATIGCCWDADRLDLSRLGQRPKPAFLSTAAARKPELQARAWEAGWDERLDAAGAAAWGLSAARP